VILRLDKQRRAGPLSDTTLAAVLTWRLERRRYFDLIRGKRSEYWKTRVESERLQPSRLWQSFDQVMGRGRAPVAADIDASVLNRFSTTKSPASVTPLPVRLPRSSLWRPSVASYDSFDPSRRLMSSRWYRNYRITVLPRSSADMASESQCQSSGAISVSAFQLVTATRYRSVEYEVRLCHTDT